MPLFNFVAVGHSVRALKEPTKGASSPLSNKTFDFTPFHSLRIPAPEDFHAVRSLSPNEVMEKFYMLESLDAYKGSGAEVWDPTRNHVQAHWDAKNFKLEQRAYVYKIAPWLHMYLTKAIAGELSLAYPEPTAMSTEGSARIHSVLPSWMSEDPEEILQNIRDAGMTYAQFSREAEKLFKDESIWVGMHGGERWAQVARAMRSFDEKRPEIWLDHVFDLQHNHGSVFTKHRGYERSRGSDFLHYKFGEDEDTDPVSMTKWLRDYGDTSSYHYNDNYLASFEDIAQRGRNVKIW